MIAIPKIKTLTPAALAAAAVFAAASPSLMAQTATNLAVMTPSLPDSGASVFRVFGALALVIALFLGGVWLFKNWRRFSGGGKSAARLNILEARSLGQKQALFVIGYQERRFLVASTPGNISLLTALPSEPTAEKQSVSEAAASEGGNPALSFAEAFQQVLNRK